eukprot:4831071-Heterocapsa_arctica.AAC.1
MSSLASSSVRRLRPPLLVLKASGSQGAVQLPIGYVQLMGAVPHHRLVFNSETTMGAVPHGCTPSHVA